MTEPEDFVPAIVNVPQAALAAAALIISRRVSWAIVNLPASSCRWSVEGYSRGRAALQ